jgi:hypothetical protein
MTRSGKLLFTVTSLVIGVVAAQASFLLVDSMALFLANAIYVWAGLILLASIIP